VRDVDTEKSGITDGWLPLPRGLDMFAGARPHRWAAEVKVWDISQQIWDALKLAAGIVARDLNVGYLIAAACPSAFATQGGKELFSSLTSRGCDVRRLVETNAHEWQDDLNGGSARPVLLPANIHIQTLIDEPCWFGHRVCLVRIDVPEPAEKLRFVNGWPVGFKPDGCDIAIKRPRAPTTDAIGIAVPARWSDAWWAEQLRRGVTPDQFEALYGLLLTRGWSDPEIRSRVQPPTAGAPAWWT
jgi:hypothetical protein